MWSFEGEEEGWCERDGGRGDVILLCDLICEIGCGYRLNYLEMLVMYLLLSDVMLVGGRWIQKKGCIQGLREIYGKAARWNDMSRPKSKVWSATSYLRHDRRSLLRLRLLPAPFLLR